MKRSCSTRTSAAYVTVLWWLISCNDKDNYSNAIFTIWVTCHVPLSHKQPRTDHPTVNVRTRDTLPEHLLGNPDLWSIWHTTNDTITSSITATFTYDKHAYANTDVMVRVAPKTNKRSGERTGAMYLYITHANPIGGLIGWTNLRRVQWENGGTTMQ